MSETLHVGIVGGGIAGLATALQLVDRAAAARLDLQVTVCEASSEVGGHLQTLREDGFTIEAGPNGFLDNEPATLRLVERLGLTGELQRSSDAARRRFILLGGRLREIPVSPGSFLRSDLLSWRGKLRVAGEPFVPRRAGLGREADDPTVDETVDAFGRRRLGNEFAERLLDPMVKGIFGGDSRQLSLAAAFPRMIELEREHGSLVRALIALSRQRRRMAQAGPSGALHSFRDGMARLPRRLAEVLAATGRVRLLTGTPVTAVVPDGDRWRLETAGETVAPCDHVVVTAPAHVAARLLPGERLQALLDGIPFSSLAVVSLAFRREDVHHPLDGFGLLVPGGERRQLLGVLWTSSIFPGRAPDGTVLLRCMAGGPDAAVLDRSAAELVDLALAECRQLLGLRGAPLRSRVFRHRRGIAQYVRGHPARLRAIAAELALRPGLSLAGSSYRGIAVNHCVAEAERTAERLIEELAERTARSRAAVRGEELA